ncbi:MAG: type II toxin-antitoxin system HicB family antitoxin [Paludibacteraceae bacterium]|nr:type II toxin-antitoxin system HicB family antitoxin [Paludibacteraceae bacterium]
MKKVTVMIEYADNNLSAYVCDVDGITATGKDEKKVKESVKEAIELYVETCNEMELEIPDILKGEYEIEYEYDLCSFLNAYSKVLSKSALESLTGVNQKQLWHYASGKRKPSKQTLEKVADSIHAFAEELCKVRFTY